MVACCFLVACGETRHAWGRGWDVDERPRMVCPAATRLLLRTEFNDFFYQFLKGPPLSKSSFLLLFLFVAIKEKSEGEPQIVSFLLGICPVSVTTVISPPDFFLLIGTPMEKSKNHFMGPVKFPINRIFIHLDTKPRRREQYMPSSQWS